MGVVVDTFAAADGTLLTSHTGETGATWTSQGGSTPQIGSNRLWCSSAGVSVTTASGIPASADYSVLARCRRITAAGSWVGVVARCTSAEAFYMLIYNIPNDRLELYVYNSGFGFLGASGTLGFSDGTDFKLQLVCVGASIVGKINGLTVISATDSTLTATGKSGVLFYDSGPTSITGVHIDSFQADPPEVVKSITDPNWFFSPFVWRKEGSDFAETANVGAYFKTVFNGANCSILIDGTPLSGSSAGNLPEVIVTLDDVAQSKVTLGIGTTAIPVLYDGPSAAHSLRLDFIFSGPTDRWLVPSTVVRLTGLSVDAGTLLSTPSIEAKTAIWFGDSISEQVWTDATYLVGDARNTQVPLFATALGAEMGRIAFQQQGYTEGGGGNVPALLTVGDPENTAWNQFSDGNSRLVSGALDPVPDYLFCWHGENDGAASDATVAARVQAWIADVRAAAGANCYIFILIPSKQTKRSAITDGVAGYQATHPSDDRVFLIDPDQNFTLTPEYVISDQIHLTSLGQEAYFASAWPIVETHLSPTPSSSATRGGFFFA